ncbi:MAG TPA: hypothetical protein DD734_10575 [Firmicutes bacterium]|nr:hypothetical protein [Bacillota bacterium]
MLTIMVGFFAFTAEATSISVTPPRLQFTARAGEYFEGQIEVYGSNEQEIRVKTYFMDWNIDPNGTVQFYSQPPPEARAATPWLRMEPQEFLLPAGGKRLVTISGQVPEGTRPGDYWSMFFVEFIPYSVLQTSGVRMSGRVGGSITITVPGTVAHRGRIDAFQIQQDLLNIQPRFTAQVTFTNEGDTILEPTGQIQIKDFQNKTVGTMVIPEFKILPQSQRTLRLQEELKLKPGNYIAIAILDYGGSKLAGYQRVFSVQ